jgi:uncharacterized membrane protein (DUF106 family)
MMENIIVIVGIGVIVGCFSFYFKRFWEVYNKQVELQEYMQSDEYKEKMKKYQNALKKKNKEAPKNMYR